MLRGHHGWLPLLALVLLAISAQNAQALTTRENGVKSAVFLLPELTLQPGSVSHKFYYDIDFPSGHIAIKSFNAEVVDDAGNPVPLHETYLHHWAAIRYYKRQGFEVPKYNTKVEFKIPDVIAAGNSGLCKNVLLHFFGRESETRKTASDVPDPYGIEVGNPAEIPEGYVEKWMIDFHAIDTRGAEDKLGCTECRCDLYNVTTEKYARPLKPNYGGGFHCCYDESQCRVKEGFQSIKRSLYLRYTVEWVDWENSIVPVKVYVFDVTDTWKKLDGSAGLHDCKMEYEIEPCSGGVARDQCFDSKRFTLSAPISGNIVYAVGHQHRGGTGIALYGEDGRLLCLSVPVYGEGNEVGNEAGYMVGMSTCYPQPGSVKISIGETIVLESNYSSAQRHTGVMGHFYILVAEPASGLDYHPSALTQVMFGVVISAAIVVLAYRRKSPEEDTNQLLSELINPKPCEL